MQSTAVLASVALLLGAQAQVAPLQPPANARMPGIVEKPGSTRTPGFLEVRGNTGGARDSTYQRDLRKVHRDIDRRRDNGELTKREARQLRREAAMIARLADRYGRDGLSASESRELDMHAQTLRSQAAIRGTHSSSKP